MTFENETTESGLISEGFQTMFTCAFPLRQSVPVSRSN
jgi:hypothetical protein